jgi:hypothetical protein
LRNKHMIERDSDKKLLRGHWQVIRLDWRLGLSLIIGVGSIRFYLILQANMTTAYQSVSLIFLLMMLLPIILLNRVGLKAVGLTRPPNWK